MVDGRGAGAGELGNAWVWLGAAGHATKRVSLGPAVTAITYTEPIHDPAQIERNGQEISDAKFKAMAVISSDPRAHVRKLTALRQLEPTAMVLMNVSGADPLGTLRVYGEQVLPELRALREQQARPDLDPKEER